MLCESSGKKSIYIDFLRVLPGEVIFLQPCRWKFLSGILSLVDICLPAMRDTSTPMP
jgi:hypothetical protein